MSALDADDRSRQKLAIFRDPLVTAIVERLSLGDSTAVELAAATGVPVEKVRRHLRKMREAGLVERIGRTERRGVGEYLHRFDQRAAILSSEELAALPRRDVDEADLQILRTIYGEAIGSIEAGSFGSDPHHIAIRFPMRLVGPLLQRAVEIQDRLLEEILDSASRARARLKLGGGDPIDTVAALILLPLPTSALLRPTNGEDGAVIPPTRVSARDRIDYLTTLADPVRVSIADLLSLKPAGAAELADLLGITPQRCRAELRRLVDAGVLAVHERRQRRGTLEYVYVLDPVASTTSAGDEIGVDRSRIRKLKRMTASMIFRDAVAALRSRELVPPESDSHLSRISMRVDAEGVKEISESIERSFYRLLDLQQKTIDQSPPITLSSPVAISGQLLFARAPNVLLPDADRPI